MIEAFYDGGMSAIAAVLTLPDAVPRSPLGLAARRFVKNRLALAGLIVIAGLILACFCSIPWATGVTSSGVPRYADQMNLAHVKEAPSAAFWMGTDSLGRDLRPRFLLGGAISLTMGLASAMIAICIGTGVGMVAGYLGGRVDATLMRMVDLLYGLPYILLVILMRVSLAPLLLEFLEQKDGQGRTRWFSETDAGQWSNFLVLLVGIGSVSWLTLARVVRGQVMSLREQPFVEAARALGFGWPRIIGRHILPNLVGTIVVYGTLTVPAAILSESFLSFLSLGIAAPVPSWGNLAFEGTEALNPVHVRWWLIAWPCAGLSVALLCLNFIGDGVRDALDPKG